MTTKRTCKLAFTTVVWVTHAAVADTWQLRHDDPARRRMSAARHGWGPVLPPRGRRAPVSSAVVRCPSFEASVQEPGSPQPPEANR